MFETVPSERHRCKLIVLTGGRGEEMKVRNEQRKGRKGVKDDTKEVILR
jgi:hypothetical protein